MAKKKLDAFGDMLWDLHWILRIVLVIFTVDIIYGLARFADGIREKDVLKIVLGFFWIFGGLVIGWIFDILCVCTKTRPWLL